MWNMRKMNSQKVLTYGGKLVDFLNLFGELKGGTWVNVWGLVGLYRFAVGKEVDWGFLGVVGLYTISKIVKKD